MWILMKFWQHLQGLQRWHCETFINSNLSNFAEISYFFCACYREIHMKHTLIIDGISVSNIKCKFQEMWCVYVQGMHDVYGVGM